LFKQINHCFNNLLSEKYSCSKNKKSSKMKSCFKKKITCTGLKPLFVHQDCSRVGAQFRCPPQELVVLVTAGEIKRGAAPQGVVRRDVCPNQTVAGGCVPENQ
jgi:hypothetical protein